ncbi:MAG: diacylglycerol kinase family lipid kinase [Lachnospiraceae bacterium]|nr:diacylglycerol kinase family lipid kinase [Lachnospiraceae bacterium]
MYHFIVNPGSRSKYSTNLWSSLEDILKSRNIIYRAYLTEYAGHATEYARSIEAEYRSSGSSDPLMIVIVGGDGTANEVINGLVSYQNLILGIIPSGSGNDLAHSLGLPSDPFQALEIVLARKKLRSVDHGLLHYFDGTAAHRFDVSAGLGYDAAVCYDVQHSPLKKKLNRLRLGKLTYIIIAVKNFFSYKPVNAKITVDGTEKHIKLLFAAAMLGKYEGGGLKMAPQACLDDRLLSVCVIEAFAKWKFFYLLPSLLFGKHVKFKEVTVYDCASFEIQCDTPTILHTDGEYGGTHAHVKFTCTPEQIQVIC